MVIGFKKLCAVEILHHYFLDLGSQDFNGMDAEGKERQLRHYDIHRVLALVPTRDTRRQLNDYNLLAKATPRGIIICADSAADVPSHSPDAQLRLTFLLKLLDGNFLNYTRLFFDATNQKFTTQKKGHGFYFSNLTRSTTAPRLSVPSVDFSLGKLFRRGDVVKFQNQFFHALKDIPAAGPEPPDASAWELVADLQLPYVFLENRVDPLDLANSGSGSLFGILEIGGAASGGFALTQADGQLQDPAPVFRIELPNHSTFWRYLHAGTGNELAQTETPVPITARGGSELKLNDKDLPPPSANLLPFIRTVGTESRLTTDIRI
ncbi:MAG: hypothetical protein ACKVU0_13855 [Saprospiraceae bacterium]